RRARGEDLVHPGQPGVQRPAELRPGHRPAAAPRHRQRHHLRVDHGARIIDLPLDPGTAGLTGQGSPAAAGGSPAEQAAVAYALRRNVVLVAPAGDDGQGPDLTDHPAAYAGVIAAGAIARNGRLAPFSNRHSYVS